MLAVSGIDHTIKIFSPDGRERQNARKGIGITPSDSAGFSTLSLGRSRPARSDDAETAAGEEEDNVLQEEDEEPLGVNGLSSRKRMHLEYRITSQNDVERRGGNREAYVTVRYLISLKMLVLTWLMVW
jgi:DDB1- and CUL4-associated factor 6